MGKSYIACCQIKALKHHYDAEFEARERHLLLFIFVYRRKHLTTSETWLKNDLDVKAASICNKSRAVIRRKGRQWRLKIPRVVLNPLI